MLDAYVFAIMNPQNGLELIVWPQRFRKSSVFICTRTRENSVLKKFHSGERFRKVPFSLIDFIGYLWTEAVSVKKKLRFRIRTDTCGQGLVSRIGLFMKMTRQIIYQTGLSQNTVIHHKITGWKLIADNDNCPCLKSVTQNHFNFHITDDRI